jgi:VIT1/CCC1 family predicted Fe2+/Mn2+ transporter
MIDVAGESYYVAKIIEQHWRQLLTAPSSAPSVQRRMQDTIRGLAAGMHEIGLSATFSTSVPDSKETFEAKLTDIIARQLTALTTFRYGDLIVAEAGEITSRPWLQRVLRSIRSVIASLAPITPLLVLPKALKFTISASLYGTLLTVSLAWLALYVIGWLDPKALANVSSLPKVIDLLEH